MKQAGWRVAVTVLVIAGVSGSAQEKSRVDLKKPLVLASQGSFFVGGEKKALPAPPALPGGRGGFGGGDVTVNQMYVQYQVPPNGNRHVPVVMVHGCCLSSKTWETTPDGRMGWDEVLRAPRSSGVSRRPGLARASGLRSLERSAP